MGSEIGKVVGQLWRSWSGVALLSGISNVLALSGSIFMLSVYDRVIPSGSVPTLVALGVICLLAYGLQAFVDATRGLMLTRIGLTTKEALSPRVFDVSLRGAATGDETGSRAARDLDQIQGFLSSAAPTTLFDLPWIPLYLSVCFLFHFWIGVLVTASAVFLVLLAVAGELLSRSPSSRLTEANAERAALLSTSQQEAETIAALGMTGNLAQLWERTTGDTVRLSRRLADAVSVAGSVSRTTRMVVQSSVLALGAYLVIAGEATGGIMIASSILSARALAPIDLAIANSRAFLTTRESWKRLNRALAAAPAETTPFVPQRPSLSLVAERVSAAPRSASRTVLSDVSFDLVAGSCLAVLGNTGSGKSTLARVLVGTLPPLGGTVRLDGTQLLQWPSLERGKFVGYLPQRVVLLEGTIAQNISRFDPSATADAVVEAARIAGIHELISRLPDGYSTMLGAGGVGLSGGQTQRVGLARALYGSPFLVVLDEPNSNADAESDAELLRTLKLLKERGAITVIATHRVGVLAQATHALVLAGGQVQQFGKASEVVAQLRQPDAKRVSNAA